MSSPDSHSITLIAFGRRGYGLAAHNAIASLRHHGYSGPIDLFITEELWPLVTATEGVTMYHIQSGDPGWIKLNIPEIIKRPTLYLDVDVLALGDVTPFVEALASDPRHFIISVQGTGTSTSKHIGYFGWAKPDTVATKEGFPHDARLYGIQSSWMWMRPGMKLEALADRARVSYLAWEARDLRNRWGASKPDELFWSIACTATGHDPSYKGEEPMWYGAGIVKHQEITSKYILMTLPGQRQTTPARALDIYAAEARRFKGHKPDYIFGDKHANFKNPIRHGMS